MNVNPTTPDPGTATGSDLAAKLDRAGRRLVRTAAELLDASTAAMRLEPTQLVVAHPAAGPGGSPAAARLWASLTARLGRQRVLAISDLEATVEGEIVPPGLRSCLAVPLIGSRGRSLGALCVADDRKREWTDQEIERLVELAAQAAAEIEPSRRAHSWRMNRVLPTRGLAMDVDGFVANASELLRKGAIDRADEEALDTAREALQTSVEELRVVNEELHAARWITEMEREHYRELFECVPYPYLITTPDGAIQEANDAAAALLGCRRGLLAGKPLISFVPEGDRPGFRSKLREIRSGGRSEWPLSLKPRGAPARTMVCATNAAPSHARGTSRLYWLFREAPVEDTSSPREPETREAIESPIPPSGVAGRKRAEFEELIARVTPAADATLVTQLRALIAGGLDAGNLQIGQRLPSIRAIAEHFGATSYAALQAYAALEAEGVVERRERSGVYVAPIDWPVPPRLPETAEWMARVLTDACGHQVRIPQLPDLIRRWTASTAVRAVCVESCADTLAALSHDLANRFGIEANEMAIDELLASNGGQWRPSAIPPAVEQADLLVTTAYHASRVRPIAEAVGKPLLVATGNPEILDAIEAHASTRELTVICVDARFGERIRDIEGGIYRKRIRVLLASNVAATGLDRVGPVFVTFAARERLNGLSVRLVAPPTPAFSLDFARKIAATLLSLNLNAGRA